MNDRLSRKEKTVRAIWVGAASLIAISLLAAVVWLPSKQLKAVQQGLPLARPLEVKEEAELINQYRGTVISAIGTFATALGGIFLFLNFKLATTKVAAEKRLNESRLTAEQFTKSADFLSNENLYVRLCGIYSLGKLVEDFPEVHYRTVIEILTTFIKRESPSNYKDDLRSFKEAEDEGGYIDVSPPSKIKTDVQVALTVLERIVRYKEDEKTSARELIDLSGTNLRQANLHGANLSKINLEDAYLAKADLRGANLRGANLSGAFLHSGTDLSGADLRKAIFCSAVLDYAILIGADLREADLSEANLNGAKLMEATLSGRKLKFKAAKITNANLSEADLSEADLSDAELRGTFLTNAILRDTILEKSTGLVKEQVDQGLLCNTRPPKGIALEADRDCAKLKKLDRNRKRLKKPDKS